MRSIRFTAARRGGRDHECRSSQIHAPLDTHGRNQHAADTLATVRQEIHALQAYEQQLRQELLSSKDLVGDEFEAIVQHCEQERFDTKTAIKCLVANLLRPFFRTIAYDAVKSKPRQMKTPRAGFEVQRAGLMSSFPPKDHKDGPR